MIFTCRHAQEVQRGQELFVFVNAVELPVATGPAQEFIPVITTLFQLLEDFRRRLVHDIAEVPHDALNLAQTGGQLQSTAQLLVFTDFVANGVTGELAVRIDFQDMLTMLVPIPY